jgi:hypothetical protein
VQRYREELVSAGHTVRSVYKFYHMRLFSIF